MSLHVVLTHVDAVRSWNSFDPGIFENLVLASFFRKMTATEQKLPSVSTANGTTMEDGGIYRQAESLDHHFSPIPYT